MQEQDRLESQHNLQQVDQFGDTLLALMILRFLYMEPIVFCGVLWSLVLSKLHLDKLK